MYIAPEVIGIYIFSVQFAYLNYLLRLLHRLGSAECTNRAETSLLIGCSLGRVPIMHSPSVVCKTSRGCLLTFSPATTRAPIG